MVTFTEEILNFWCSESVFVDTFGQISTILNEFDTIHLGFTLKISFLSYGNCLSLLFAIITPLNYMCINFYDFKKSVSEWLSFCDYKNLNENKQIDSGNYSWSILQWKNLALTFKKPLVSLEIYYWNSN